MLAGIASCSSFSGSTRLRLHNSGKAAETMPPPPSRSSASFGLLDRLYQFYRFGSFTNTYVSVVARETLQRHPDWPKKRYPLKLHFTSDSSARSSHRKNPSSFRSTG